MFSDPADCAGASHASFAPDLTSFAVGTLDVFLSTTPSSRGLRPAFFCHSPHAGGNQVYTLKRSPVFPVVALLDFEELPLAFHEFSDQLLVSLAVLLVRNVHGGRFVWQAWLAGLLSHKLDCPGNIEMAFYSPLPGSPRCLLSQKQSCGAIPILSLKGATFIVCQRLSP